MSENPFPELERFGSIYASGGRWYLRTMNTQILADDPRVSEFLGKDCSTLKPFEGKVTRFEHSQDPSEPLWWELLVESVDRPILLHDNWVVEKGKVREGQTVEGLIDLSASGDGEEGAYKLWLLRYLADVSETEVSS